MATYPWQNKGAYEWVPDDYGATSGASFGVMNAFDSPVIDIGRPQNVLPKGVPYGGRETRIIAQSLRSATGSPIGNVDSAAAVPPDAAWNPFLRKIIRASSLELKTAPIPGVDGGFGMSSLDVNSAAGTYPYYIFTLDKAGAEISSVMIEYLLCASVGATGLPGTAVRVVGLFSQGDVNDTWWNTSRDVEGGRWGPPSSNSFSSGIAAVASGLLGMPLLGIYLPQIVFDPSGNEISDPYLGVTHPNAYEDWLQQDWSKVDVTTVFVRTSNHYWTSTEYFPALKAMAIIPTSDPNWYRPSTQDAPGVSWNLKVSGIRVYDALMVNGVPQHEETQSDGTTKIVKSHFPCKVFGYAWRVSHSVALTGDIKRGQSIQPPLASTTGRPPATFRFRIYDPETELLGVAHGVKFYYLLVVLAVPGTAPGFGGSLIGLLTEMVADMDLLLVQYAGIMPGMQTMTFVPTNSQYDGGTSLGRTVYAGQFAFSRLTVALKCFKSQGTGLSGPPAIGAPLGSTWVDIGPSSLPASAMNGRRGLWYDAAGNSSSWYTFLALNQTTAATFGAGNAASYAGGFSAALRGSPRVDLAGPGAFSMSTTFSDTFSGADRITVYAKPRGCLRGSFNVSSWCQSSNMASHLGTFISDVFQTGGSRNGVGGYPSSVQMFTGNWRVRFVASVGDTTRDEAYLFFRFAFVDPEVDEETLNGSNLWSLPANKIQEFHFKPEVKSNSESGYWMASGPPDIGTVVSTPLTTASEAYPITWFCPGAMNGDTFASDDSMSIVNGVLKTTNQYSRTVYMDVPFSGARLVVQAWCVSFPISAAGNSPKDPSSDIFCPAVELSWAGETEAKIQTMIINVKSNAIMAHQDPLVASINAEMKTFITSDHNEVIAVPPTPALPFRTWTNYNNRLSAKTDHFVPTADRSGVMSLQKLVRLNDAAITPSGFSITEFSMSERYDGSESQAQIVDTLASVQGGDVAIFGGSAILPQNMNVSFSILTNNSTFDGYISVSIYAIDSTGLAVTLIGETRRVPFSTSGNAAFSEASRTFNETISIPVAISVSGLSSFLMVRFKMWTFSNANANLLSALPSGAGADRGFACIDISNFKVECSPVGAYTPGFPAQTDEQYTQGNNNWYMDLDVTTSRTFGANEYYFVPDEDSTRTTVMVPKTVSEYGEWFLYGWMFSPLWFIDMPANSIFEIVDRAFLTHGSPVTGTGFVSPEREQRVLRIRTAVDTISAQSLAGTRDNMQWGGDAFVVRTGKETSGATAASNFLKITKFSGTMDTDHTVPDFMVRIGETFLSGKNPLLVTMRTDNTLLNRRRLSYTPASTQIKYLFYEMDEYDIDRSEQSRIAMLASYDSYGRNWADPYAESGSVPDETARVILTSDMRMISGAVDPFGFTMYIVGYRSTDPKSPQDGGAILMRQIQPRLLYDPTTAGIGPLHFVDGFLSHENETNSWNTIAGGGQQPMLPFQAGFSSPPPATPSDVTHTNENRVGDGGTVVPAAESFPDVVIDNNCNVYVMYSMLPVNKTVIGKVYCRMSHNGGYWFGAPYPIADLGYEVLNTSWLGLINFPSNDDSFHVKHITALFDHHSQMYMIFFWAGGKIFMRPVAHPADPNSRTGSSRGGNAYTVANGANNTIYLVAGSTDFVLGGSNSGSALDRWLHKNWEAGTSADAKTNAMGSLYPPYIMSNAEVTTWMTQWESYMAHDSDPNQNNYGPKGGTVAPIRISRYGNDLDITPQRVGAFSTERGDVIVTFLDSQFNLMCKRIRFSGGYPMFSPALMVDTKEI